MSMVDGLILVAVMLSLAVMPSASVALVVASSVRFGRTHGVLVAAGIVTGDLGFAIMALLGMSVIAAQLGTLFTVVKYAGGFYLIGVGLTLLRPSVAATAGPAKRRLSSRFTAYLSGLLLTLGDVKAILFYASLFPMLVNMHQLAVGKVAIMLGLTILTVGGVKLAYALVAPAIVNKLRRATSSQVPQKIGGALMIGCGATLIAKA